MPYRGRSVVCLTCRAEMGGEDLEGVGYARCGSCDSVWISVEGLRLLVERMGAAAPLALEARKGELFRPCPECNASMAHATLAPAIPVDWCEAHGVWFDPAELGVALAAAYTDEKEWWRQFGKLVKGFT